MKPIHQFLRTTLFVAFLLLLHVPLFAQSDLFGSDALAPRSGMIIVVQANADVPVADMAKRFGASLRIGGSLLRKTKSNWLFGPKADFIFGNTINEPGLLRNIDPDGTRSALDQNGVRASFTLFERGYTIGIQGGRIFNNVLSKSPDNGLLILTTIGFIQHKILIYQRENKIPQVRGDYRKGYDRLTNGVFIEQFVGYNYFSKSGFINFSAGFNVLAGFTQGRRDFLFDTQQPGTGQRLDMLLGVRANWYVPIFRRKSEELFFE